MELDWQVCSRARLTRDARFDGKFFIAVTSTGHCHPEVVKAIQEQAAELIHISGTDFYYESLVTMAERLSAMSSSSRAARMRRNAR